MKKLAKHIEVLLLENNCVIVPGLGGFIAHYQPAHFDETRNEWVPPMRTFGFNPQLVINDGVLAQSYMQACNTDFPDATRMIEKAVAELKEQLYAESAVALNGVGKLYYTIDNRYGFEPEVSSTPALYGLESVKLSPLPSLVEQPVAKVRTLPKATKQVTDEKSHSISGETLRKWWGNMVAAAAAVLLFFALSSPVQNTYIDETSYASLGSSGLFEAIRNQSFATTVQHSNTSAQQQVRVKNNINTLKPVAVKVEKVEKKAEKAEPKADKPAKAQPAVQTASNNAAEKKSEKAENRAAKETPAQKSEQPKNSKTSAAYYVIVSSVSTREDAENGAKKLQSKGFAQAQAVHLNNKHRIALYTYSSREAAQQKVNELRKGKDYSSAWVLSAQK